MTRKRTAHKGEKLKNLGRGKQIFTDWGVQIADPFAQDVVVYLRMDREDEQPPFKGVYCVEAEVLTIPKFATDRLEDFLADFERKAKVEPSDDRVKAFVYGGFYTKLIKAGEIFDEKTHYVPFENCIRVLVANNVIPDAPESVGLDDPALNKYAMKRLTIYVNGSFQYRALPETVPKGLDKILALIRKVRGD